MTGDEVLDAIDRGIQLGVRAALREHKRMGRSVVIWRDGRVVEVPPEEIPDFDEGGTPMAPTTDPSAQKRDGQ